MSFSCAFWPFPSHYLLTCPSRLFILASATLKSLFWHPFSPMPWVNSSSSVPPWCPVFALIACIPTTPLCISLPYKKDERLRIRISSKLFLYSQWLGKKNNKCWLNGRINILLNENKMMRLPFKNHLQVANPLHSTRDLQRRSSLTCIVRCMILGKWHSIPKSFFSSYKGGIMSIYLTVLLERAN